MKNSIDALGRRPDRHVAFTGEMLSNAHDVELQQIVYEAAEELGTPIALVNLILEHNQFFKAHFGLPAALEAARGTTRDVSFCQYVVRDGKPFYVTDAKEDMRIPQHLVEHYGIRSYLGVPVIANDIVVGSLCVIDTTPRSFTEQEEQALLRLSELVNARLAILSTSSRQKQVFLSNTATAPALQTIRQSASPIQALSDEGLLATKSVAQFLRLVQYSLNDPTLSAEAIRQELKSAQTAIDLCENSWLEVSASVLDVNDALEAMEQLYDEQPDTQLHSVLEASRDLTRQSTQSIGGIHIVEPDGDVTLVTTRAGAVALLTNALHQLANAMGELSLKGGLRVVSEKAAAYVDIQISGGDLPQGIYNGVREKLWAFANSDPALRLPPSDSALIIRFLLAG